MRFPTMRQSGRSTAAVAAMLTGFFLSVGVFAQYEPGRLPSLGDSRPTAQTFVTERFAVAGLNANPVRVRSRFLMDPMSPPEAQRGLLQIEARIAPGFHVGSLTQLPDGPKVTAIHLKPSEAFQLLERFEPDVAPIVVPSDLFPVAEEYHTKTVVWSAPIGVAAGVDPNTLLVQGYLSGQACEEGKSCRDLSRNLTAFTARFEGLMIPDVQPAVQEESAANVANAKALIQQVGVTSELDAFPPLLELAPAPVATSSPPPMMPMPLVGQAAVSLVDPAAAPLVGQAAAEVVATQPPSALMTTLYYFGLAFVAGFILNFMPCVLPVIGLKVMSFVQQAGESRGRVLTLNIFFVLGMLTVFMLLACLTAFLGYGWGGLFQRAEFSIAMVCIVFVFALSMLGVWEIPSPSFAGRGAAVDLAEKEGVSGAFFKGVLTTLLATPCTGPLLGTALGWAVKQPRPIIFGSFLCMGLGMGIPYILFALSPKLMSLLPKPGAWMDTFKNVMGFVLLGTVVWLFYGMSSAYVVPTIALIFTLWAACWAIGRVPITAAAMTKMKTYVSALVFASIVGYFSFVSLVSEPAAYASPGGQVAQSAEDVDFDGHWPRYTQRADIDHFVDKGVPVFVDFTAKW